MRDEAAGGGEGVRRRAEEYARLLLERAVAAPRGDLSALTTALEDASLVLRSVL